MTKLPEYLQELAELEKKSTKVVSWYAHPNTVRGPYNRWFTCSGGEGYPNNVADIEDDCKFAAASMNAVPQILSDFQKLLDERAEMIKVLEFYGDEDHYWESHNGASNIRTVDQGHKARAMLDKLKGESK